MLPILSVKKQGCCGAKVSVLFGEKFFVKSQHTCAVLGVVCVCVCVGGGGGGGGGVIHSVMRMQYSICMCFLKDSQHMHVCHVVMYVVK